MRKYKRRILSLVVVLALVGYIYFEMTQLATKRLKLHFETVVSEKIPSSFNNQTMAFMSDVDGDVNNLRKAVKEIKTFNPDTVVFLGSLLKADEFNEDTNNLMIELLSDIKTNSGKIAVLSEKDNETSRQILEASGFLILENQDLLFYNPDHEAIKIIGLGATSGEVIVEDNNYFTLALSYNPDQIDANTDKNFDLMVAGKSMLGKIRLPFIGPLAKETKYAERRQTVSNTELILTSGVSTTDPDIRLFTNPDVLILTLKNAQ